MKTPLNFQLDNDPSLHRQLGTRTRCGLEHYGCSGFCTPSQTSFTAALLLRNRPDFASQPLLRLAMSSSSLARTVWYSSHVTIVYAEVLRTGPREALPNQPTAQTFLPDEEDCKAVLPRCVCELFEWADHAVPARGQLRCTAYIGSLHQHHD